MQEITIEFPSLLDFSKLHLSVEDKDYNTNVVLNVCGGNY